MKIAVLGLGAYGIALASVFYENDNKVSMWSKFKDEVDIVKLKREKVAFFDLKDLESGEFRKLTPKEVAKVFALEQKENSH